MLTPYKKYKSESEYPRVGRAAYPLLSDRISDKPVIAVIELINCLARHNVVVPDSEADQIEEFARRWLDEPRGQLERLLSPTATLERLYRRWQATGYLHFELSEHPDTAPAWRNESGTGQPSKLDAEGARKAMSYLEALATDASQRYGEILAGKRALGNNNRSKSLDEFLGAEANWFDCLVFETGAVQDFFRDASTDELAQKSSQGNASKSAAPVVRRVVRMERRDLLDPAIDQAIKDANDSLKTADVWLRLEQLALGEFPPFKGIRGKRGYKYEKTDSAGNTCIEEFTKGALDARLRRRKEAEVSGE